MMDDSYKKKLKQSYTLREAIIREAVCALQLKPGSQGLDVGCGIGDISMLLAESVAPLGHVTGVDLSSEFIAYARNAAKKSGLSNQVSFREEDMRDLSFEDNVFDWGWSSDCVGYIPLEPLPLIEEMVRVVKPGGKITILAWSSQLLLPGYPTLEAKLNSTSAGTAPFSREKDHNHHFLRSLSWFQELGLENPKALTFVRTLHSPLSDGELEALISLFQMRWLGVQAELSKDDWETFQLLCQPKSSEFILNIPDYYAFFTYSLFTASVPHNS